MEGGDRDIGLVVRGRWKFGHDEDGRKDCRQDAQESSRSQGSSEVVETRVECSVYVIRALKVA